jgi:hypothetical protein
MEIIFIQLGVCYYRAASLTRGRICNLQLLLGLTSSVFLVSESRGTLLAYCSLPILRPPQLGWPGSFICFSQEQGGPVTPPVNGFPFCRLLLLAGPRWRCSNPPPLLEVRSYPRPIVIRPVLVSSHHLGPATNFPFSSMEMFSYEAPSLTRGWVYNLQCSHSLVRTS